MPHALRLSTGETIVDVGKVVVVNQGDHTEAICVLADVVAPAFGGCTPNARILNTLITLPARGRTTLVVTVSYTCTSPSAANGLNYTWIAAADAHDNDLGSCSFSIDGPCTAALADDDADPTDNIKSKPLPIVKFVAP